MWGIVGDIQLDIVERELLKAGLNFFTEFQYIEGTKEIRCCQVYVISEHFDEHHYIIDIRQPYEQKTTTAFCLFFYDREWGRCIPFGHDNDLATILEHLTSHLIFRD
ncbi:hypothetical protein ACPV56_19975 [Vibrio astriarenae]